MRSTRRRGHRLRGRLTISVVVALCVGVAAAAQTRRPANRPAAPAAARHPPSKAIFEPVNYPQDVRITGIFFINADAGWICGDDGRGSGGFIAATRDGGRSWSRQAGAANMPALVQLSFVDATHGWAAAADGALLHTIDGSNWTTEARFPGMRAMAFISAQSGVAIDAGEIRTTTDGGRSWQPSRPCRVTIETPNGPRESSCEPRTIAFAPDRRTGYVIADVNGAQSSAVITTSDGGATWMLASVVDAVAADATLAFADALTGFLRTRDVLQVTADGGHTWHGVAAPLPVAAPGIAIAGPVGWMVGSQEFSYTLDHGKRWISRRVGFPHEVVTFTVVDAETGYVAGAHGMIFRFRIVPFDFSVPHMLTIPGMTTFVAPPAI